VTTRGSHWGTATFLVVQRRRSALVLVALISVFAVVLSSCGSEERATRLAFASGADADRTDVERVSPELPELVNSFRRARSETDNMPGDPVAALRQSGDAQPGEDPALSRRLELAGGQHAYAWPMRNGVCYSWPAATGCSPTAVLAEKGVLVGTSYVSESEGNLSGRPPGWQVFALARDGIGELRLALRDGSEITREVTNNGVLISLLTAPTKARWQNLDGTEGIQPLAGASP
jgi:hypothetical protein